MKNKELKWQSSTAVDKRFSIGRVRVKFSVRCKDGVMGRFGGGWNWKLGIQAGGSTIIFSLLVAELTVRWHKPKEK